MTVLEAVKCSVGFPISNNNVEMLCIRRGVELEDDFTSETDRKSFDLVVADCIKLGLTTPNVSEGGVSISMPDRNSLIQFANGIYSRYGEALIQSEYAIVKALEW